MGQGSKIKVALIGYGHLGKWHAQKTARHPEAELYAIVEPSPERQKAAAENHPGAKIVSDAREIMGAIDAAIVVTPTKYHLDCLKQVLSHGKHVFCEKPLVSNGHELRQVEALMKPGTVLQVGHSERFHEIWERESHWRPYLADNAIIRMNRLAPFKGRATDVDVIQDLMIHDLDLLLFLLQETPIALQAWGQQLFSGKWDYVTCTLEFKSKKTGFVTVGRYYPQEVRSVELVNQHGTCLIDLMNRQVKKTSQALLADTANGGIESFEYPQRDHLDLEQQAFFKAIRSHGKPPVGLKEGGQVIQLMDQVLASLETGAKISL